MITNGMTAPIDLRRRDRRDRLPVTRSIVFLGRRDAAEIEQREAEGRMQERGLHVDAQAARRTRSDRCRASPPPGRSSGTMMKASSKKSRKKASTKTIALTTIRKPIWPPGRLVSRLSTQRSPLTPRKIRLNTVEPIRMNMTKERQLRRRVHRLPQQLTSRAGGWRRPGSARRSRPSRRPRSASRCRRKIVPSTRKISAKRRHHDDDDLLREPAQRCRSLRYLSASATT